MHEQSTKTSRERIFQSIKISDNLNPQNHHVVIFSSRKGGTSTSNAMLSKLT